MLTADDCDALAGALREISAALRGPDESVSAEYLDRLSLAMLREADRRAAREMKQLLPSGRSLQTAHR